MDSNMSNDGIGDVYTFDMHTLSHSPQVEMCRLLSHHLANIIRAPRDAKVRIMTDDEYACYGDPELYTVRDPDGTFVLTPTGVLTQVAAAYTHAMSDSLQHQSDINREVMGYRSGIPGMSVCEIILQLYGIDREQMNKFFPLHDKHQFANMDDWFEQSQLFVDDNLKQNNYHVTFRDLKM